MSSDFFNDIFNTISGEDFEEQPVEIEEFVQDILHHVPLSPNQYKIIKASSQIYHLKTLISLYGEERGTARFEETFNEVICALGKASGKDMMARISCAYVIYLLLCLRDPQAYFGKPMNDAIDVMNIAINADQANRVFFRQFVQLIKGAEWFDGKYDAKRGEINFDKNINLVSGHSQSESLEGYNVIFVVLDEISGFSENSDSGNKKAVTSDSVYKMHRASVDSRFPEEGKVILLSFPRYENDFITQRYEDVVEDKIITVKSHTFKRDPALPDGREGNEFTVEWEEDTILRYKYPKMFALKLPTWEVNPTRTIDMFTRAFDSNVVDALARFAAQPSKGGDDAVFKNHAAIDESFVATNGVDKDGIFWDGMKPDPTKEYFIHVDLAQKHDRCAVVMAHVDKFVTIQLGGSKMKEIHPTVKVDAVRWWQPTSDMTVDFKWVTDYINQLRVKGYNIRLTTFDRWNSHDTRNFLESRGMKTDNLSVGNDHYTDFISILYDQRLIGPDVPELIDEMKKLRWIKGKVDHDRDQFKDLSDATCGAIFNAVKHTARPRNNVVEVHTLKDLYRKEREAIHAQGTNVIEAPRGDVETMPENLKRWLGRVL
jgi:hypothetical protein